MSSDLFKIASPYCISLARCTVFSNTILSACLVKEYLGYFFNVFIVSESKNGQKTSLSESKKNVNGNLVQRRDFSKEDLQKRVL